MLHVQILQKYWKEEPQILCLLRQAIHTSLCAGYESDKWKSPLRQCMLLYHTFQSPQRDSDEIFSEWLRDNTYVAFFALKAYLVYLMAQDPGLDCVVRQTYKWSSFEHVVGTTNDYVRQKLHERGFCADMDNEMRRMHDGELPFLYKLQKGSERAMLCRLIAQRSELDIVRSIASGEHADYVQQNQEEELRTKYHNLCMFIPNSPLFPIEWSKQIELTNDTKQVLYEVTNVYQGGKPGNNAMRLLGKISPVDFRKLVWFSIIMQKTDTFRCFQLPDIYVRKQLHAMRASRRDSVRRFCIACGCISCICTSMGNSGKKRKAGASNVYAEGHSKVVYDIVEKKMVCCKQKSVSSGKQVRDIVDLRDVVVNCKRHNDTDAACVDFYFDTDRLCSKVSKAERKRQSKLCCGDEELQQIDMLGKVLCVGKKQYVLCPNCLIVCEFDFCLHGIADQNRGTVKHPFHESLWASATPDSSLPHTCKDESDFVFACGLCNLRFPAIKQTE